MLEREYHRRTEGFTFKERRRNRKVARLWTSLNWPMMTGIEIHGGELLEAERRQIDESRRGLVAAVIKDETIAALGGLDSVAHRVVQAAVDYRLDLPGSDDWDQALQIVGYTEKRLELFPDLRDPSSKLDSIQGYGPASAAGLYELASEGVAILSGLGTYEPDNTRVRLARTAATAAMTSVAGLTEAVALRVHEWVDETELSRSLHVAFQALKPENPELARAVLLALLTAEGAPQELISSVEGDRA